ncbi:unnamed protein product, partial [Prorocentrum cordatum]
AQGKSPIAECLLIRYATQILTTERDPQVEKTLLSYLDSCLRHKSEMVTYEAARSFCQLAVMDTDGAGGSTVLGHDIVHVTTTLQDGRGATLGPALGGLGPPLRAGGTDIGTAEAPFRPAGSGGGVSTGSGTAPFPPGESLFALPCAYL